MAVEITDEHRQAVYRELCEKEGHPIDMSTAINSGDQGELPLDVRAPDDDLLPYLVCPRCKVTYIVVPESGTDYEDAEAKLLGKLKAEDTLATIIKEKAARRKEKKV